MSAEGPALAPEARRPNGTASITVAGTKPHDYIRKYLIAYNVVSLLAWSYILGYVVYHEVSGYWAPLTVNLKAQIASLLRAMSPTEPSMFTSAVFNYLLPSYLHPLVNQAASMYSTMGWQVKLVQTGALLEVLHVALGWVRSPLSATAMQVGSRLMLVWGIADRFGQAQENPLYGSMVFAWALTEVIRYAFYACNLLSITQPWLTYLRYTTFYVLYPMGAGSEAWTIFSTLPPFTITVEGSAQPAWDAWLSSPWPVVRLILFLIWWPGLWIMYNHMRVQRRKVIGSFSGKGRTLKND